MSTLYSACPVCKDTYHDCDDRIVYCQNGCNSFCSQECGQIQVSWAEGSSASSTTCVLCRHDFVTEAELVKYLLGKLSMTEAEARLELSMRLKGTYVEVKG